MRITVEFLERHNWNPYDIELFKRFLGARKYILLTRRNVKAAALKGLPVHSWLCYTSGEYTFTNHRGDRFWYYDGKLHRDDGPAILQSNGLEFWYQHGEKHRDDGPAVISSSLTEFWCQRGRLHRLDGPALINANGDKSWYRRGLLHRDDGPAIVRTSGYTAWYKNGIRIPEGE